MMVNNAYNDGLSWLNEWLMVMMIDDGQKMVNNGSLVVDNSG